MLAKSMGEILLSLDDIPTIPVVVQRLLMALQEETLAAKDLERIIRADPVISARILRVANSSFFGLSNKVGTLERAIVLLGVRFVQALALGVSLVDTLAYRRSVGRVPWKDFWLHSFACAWLCNRLGSQKPYSAFKEEAFVCGLLHDLGKPVLWVHQAEAYQRILTKINEDELEAHAAERTLLQVHHGEVGGELARWWKLPVDIQQAIGDHHQEVPSNKPARLVKVADWVAHHEGFSDGLNPRCTKPPLESEVLTQLPPSILEDLAEDLKGKHQEIEEVVNLLNSGMKP
jgi:HD-like signal output (HDOD) protein